MSFVAEGSLSLDVPPEVAFDTLADHPSWKDWMPRSFTPLSKADGPLRRGAKLKMKIVGAPATIEVTVVDRPREITWCGGIPGLLHAEHRFLFQVNGKGGTEVRSHETWSGALSALLRPVLKAQAEKVGAEQLAGLAAGCTKR